MDAEQPPPPIQITVHPGDDYAALLALTGTPAEAIPHLVGLREWSAKAKLGVCVLIADWSTGSEVRSRVLLSGRINADIAAAFLEDYAARCHAEGGGED